MSFKSLALLSLLFLSFIVRGQESTTALIRARQFDKAAKVLNDHVSDETFYNFDFDVPLLMAVEDRDTTFIRFFKQLKQQQGIFSETACIVALLCQEKRFRTDPAPTRLLIDSLSRSSKRQPLPYFYLAFYAIQGLPEKEKRQLASALLSQLETSVSGIQLNYSDSRYYAQLQFLLQSWIVKDPGEMIHVIRKPFKSSDLQLFQAVPFSDKVPGFANPGKRKQELFQSIRKNLNESTQTDLLLQMFIESPEKKLKNELRQLIKEPLDYKRRIEIQFDFYNEPVEWPDSIAAYFKNYQRHGEWIVLDVWGTWCSPCVKELPEWQKFYTNQHQLLNVNFIGLSAYSENVTEFLREKHYNFPNIEADKEWIKQLNIHSFPTTYLISPKGKVCILPFGFNKQELIALLTGN